MDSLNIHAQYMRMALAEARKAFEEEEIPVGCIILCNDRVIARAHNQREMLKDPTAHAEMIAITQAAAYLENWRLLDTTIYVTLEPCLMCMGAILEARISTLVYGTADNKIRTVSTFDILREHNAMQRLGVVSNVLDDECRAILQGFFLNKRNNSEKNLVR